MMDGNVKPQDVHATILLDKLARGWIAEHSGWAQELMQRCALRLNAGTEIIDTDNNTLQFVASMNDIYLRGMGNVPCLIISGNENLHCVVREFWQKVSLPRLLPFIFTLTERAHEVVKEVFPKDDSLILSREQIRQLLSHKSPQSFLKTLLWQQVSRRRLAPYNLLTPAEGVMFFGRQNELGRLQDEDSVSFAIAGPGRIGKTSLVRRYKDEMLRRRDPRSSCRFYINFYDCKDATQEAMARFLAMAIDASSRSSKMTADGLVNFLRYHSKNFGSPLDLLLDEVDLVCETETFKSLGAAARAGYCRLVLCGKGVLLKAALSEHSYLGCRLNLIQLAPLDEKPARELILKPLNDMGFKIVEPDKLIEKVLRLTGRLPYLLQFYGQKLGELAIEQNSETISMQHIEMLRWDFVTAQYFIKPLNDLEDPEVRLIGLSLLKEHSSEFSIPFVQTVAARAGLTISHTRANEVCNDLVINNVLAWSEGSYRISNEGLYYYAREMGFLDSALEESLGLVRARS